MASNSAQLHEDASSLSATTIDHHRAIVSLMEELEAIDWYDQRIEATADPSLRQILQHNRDEEKEHAAMLLEWLRRRDPELDVNLRSYLFTQEPIIERGAEGAGGEAGSDAVAPWSMSVGALHDKEGL